MNKPKSKLPLAFLILIFTVLAMSSCGRLNSLSPTPPALAISLTPVQVSTSTVLPTATEQALSGTISLWHSWEAPYLPALLRRIAAFQTLYPNVSFDVTYVPQVDLRNAYAEAALEGREPTLLIGQGDWGPELYERGFVEGISGMASSELLNIINSAAIEAARYQDELIGLPLHIDGVVLYRNRRLIMRSPATLEELVALSIDATQGEVFGAYLERGFYYSAAHLYGLGGALISDGGNPAFNSPQGLEWLSLLGIFEQAGPTTNFTDDDLNLFKEGRVGFIIDGAWNRNELSEAIGASNLAIDPWPVHASGGMAGFIRTENLYLSPRALSETQGVSWMFSEFLLAPESQSALADVGLIPALSGAPSVIDTLPISISDPLIAQAMRALVDSVPYPHHPDMAFYTSSLETVIRNVFEGGVDPAQALGDAENSILELIQSTRATATPSP